jgi:hypothetical protein
MPLTATLAFTLHDPVALIFALLELWAASHDGVDAPCSAASECHSVVGAEPEPDHEGEEASMERATTVGLDLAKSVFQVHGIDAAGGVVLRRKLRRPELLEFFAALPPALVGMEAHHHA